MRACKKDLTHNPIAAILEQAGFTVIDTSWSQGRLLDMIIYKRYGDVWFIEAKTGNKKLTDSEVLFVARHADRCVTLKSEADAIAWCAGRK